MKGCRLRESLKSLLGTHIEELGKSKADIGDRVTKMMMKLINDKGGPRRNSSKDSQVMITLIKDLHKQYVSVFTLYDDLMRELRNLNYDDCSSSSTSTSSYSESEHFSKEKVSRKRKWEYELLKLSEILEEELEDSNIGQLVSDSLKALGKIYKSLKSIKAINESLKKKLEFVKQQVANQQHEELEEQIYSIEVELMEIKYTLGELNNESSWFIDYHKYFFENQISYKLEDLEIAKKRVCNTKSEKEKLEAQFDKEFEVFSAVEQCLTTDLERKHSIILRGEIATLEKEIEEKKEQIVVREEEKRATIIQLCLAINYHSKNCDDLKKSLLEMTNKIQKMKETTT